MIVQKCPECGGKVSYVVNEKRKPIALDPDSKTPFYAADGGAMMVGYRPHAHGGNGETASQSGETSAPKKWRGKGKRGLGPGVKREPETSLPGIPTETAEGTGEDA